MAARRAVQREIAAGDVPARAPADRARLVRAAIDAAELQLPDAWLPFVVSQ
jgi:hypothetical protein